MKIESGEIVIVILQNPREKVLGVLHEISAAGIFLRGIDLNYFDEWIKAIKNDEPYLPMQDSFYPMWRVERISRDESSHGLSSMAEQFNQKTGLQIEDF
jgi:hypothetical protein